MTRRLKLIREALGLTQAEFAPHLGITQTAYSMIENGRRRLAPRYIKIICSEFGVAEKWLVFGEGEMFCIPVSERELSTLFQRMGPESQQFLLQIARELLHLQQTLSEHSHP